MPEKRAQSYRSLGHLAVGLGLSVETVDAAIRLLGLRPALFLNGRAYFDAAAETRLLDHLDRAGLLEHLADHGS